MSEAILTRALVKISKAPDNFDQIKEAIEEAMVEAVLRDRKRIIRGINRHDWGGGELASFECRMVAIEIVEHAK